MRKSNYLVNCKQNHPSMENEVRHNPEAARFEIEIDGQFAYAEYVICDDCVAITHTFVPRQLRGRRLAERVVEAAIEFAKKTKKKLSPVCPYVQTYVERYKPDIEVVAPIEPSTCKIS